MAVALITCVGCATVDPRADYAHAGKLIRERTGSEVAYDPAAEAEIQGRTERLLEGGLNVDEAVGVALLNNPAFQSRFLEIGVSRAEVVQSGLMQNPVVALSARMPEGGGRMNLSFSIAQELVDLWRIPVKKKIAEEQLAKTVSGVVDEAQALQAEVKKAYCTLLAARQALAVSDEDRALLQHARDLTQHQFEAGEATVLDVRLIEADAQELELRRLAQEQDLATARLAFARVLGLSHHEGEWTLQGALPAKGAAIPDDEALLKQAAENRLDLQMASQDVAEAEDAVAEQYRSVLSSLSVGIDGERPEMRAPKSRPYSPLENAELIKGPGYTTQAARLDAAHAAGNFLRDRLAAKRERDFEKQQAIDLLLGPSVAFALPLWDRNQAGIAKARIAVEQKRKDLQARLDAAAEEVQRAASAARTARDAVRLSEEQILPQAQSTLETAQRVYEAGEENILVLISAQQSLIRQREAHDSAVTDYALALVELERAVGGALSKAETEEASHGQ